jgi:hypothetical protein
MDMRLKSDFRNKPLCIFMGGTLFERGKERSAKSEAEPASIPQEAVCVPQQCFGVHPARRDPDRLAS